MTDKFQLEMQLVRDAAVPRLVDRMCIVTERHISRVELANAELMHAVRRPDAQADAVLADHIQCMSGPAMISQISRETGLKGDGLAAVTRALRQGRLAFHRTELLRPESFVWPTPGE